MTILSETIIIVPDTCKEIPQQNIDRSTIGQGRARLSSGTVVGR